MKKTRNRHILWIFGIITLGVLLIFAKLFYSQIVVGAERESAALDNRLKELTMQPNRGVIYDAKGNALAISVRVLLGVYYPEKCPRREKFVRNYPRISGGFGGRSKQS